MASLLYQTIEQISRDKHIEPEIIIAAIEDAMVVAARKYYKTEDDLRAKFDIESGQISVFAVRAVVEEVTDTNREWTLAEAKKHDPNAQIGTDIIMARPTDVLGRIAAQTAKQVIMQKVREAEHLQTASGYGAGAVRELVERKQRLDVSKLPYAVGLNFCLRNPQFALTVKWLLYLAGGFLLAMSLHFAGRPARELEKPLQVRGFHVAREALFALGFLLVVLIVSEPFLVQEDQKGITPFRLHLPGLGSAGPTGTPVSIGGFMNQVTLLTMLLFFVLQALLYTASLVKLAEIRRQGVPARMKLRLLENEDHLFDAGLYLGFLGTIISLVLVSLGVFKQPSLMAAYSSTSFGILFVVLFKVLHLRPARRTLLMESEYAPAPAEPAPTHTFAAPL